MPFHTIGYTISSVGTIAAGLLFKARLGEKLTLWQKAILSMALAIWGLVGYSILLLSYPDHEHMHQGLSILAIPLGVGLSEIFAILVISIQVIIKHLPDEFHRLVYNRLVKDEKTVIEEITRK